MKIIHVYLSSLYILNFLKKGGKLVPYFKHPPPSGSMPIIIITGNADWASAFMRTDNVYPDTSFSVLDLILNEISNEIEIERE